LGNFCHEGAESRHEGSIDIIGDHDQVRTLALNLASLIQSQRPDLIVVTDDVYGTFVPGFRSLMAEVTQNTIGVYSFSKYFGCTGWRLGVVAIHQDNIFDKALANLPNETRRQLNTRYGPLTLHPESLKFIDRMVADSRCVALNHTA